MGKHERAVGEVEAAQDKHPLPPTALVKHDKEHINKPNGHGVMWSYLLTKHPLKARYWVSTTYLYLHLLLIPHPKPMLNDSQMTRHQVSIPHRLLHSSSMTRSMTRRLMHTRLYMLP